MMHLDFVTAQAVIDRAVAAGCPRADLRWRCSPAQRTAMATLVLSVASGELAPHIIRFGASDTGTFCGIPFVTDSTVPPGSVKLERVTATTVAEVVNLAIPRLYDVA